MKILSKPNKNKFHGKKIDIKCDTGVIIIT